MLGAPSISLCSTAGGLVRHLSFTQGRSNPRPTWLMSVTFSTLFAPTTFGPPLALTMFLAFALSSAFTPFPTLALRLTFVAPPIKFLSTVLTPGRRMVTVPTFSLLGPGTFPVGNIMGVWLWGHSSPFALFSIKRG